MDQREPDRETRASDSTPGPLNAALGIVAAGVREVRRLPENAIRWPILGLNYALIAADTFRREYGSLASKGVHLVQLVRGHAPGGTSVPSAARLATTVAPGEEEDVRAEAEKIAARARSAMREAARIRREEEAAAPRPAKKPAKKTAKQAPAKKAPAKKAAAEGAAAAKRGARGGAAKVAEKAAGAVEQAATEVAEEMAPTAPEAPAAPPAPEPAPTPEAAREVGAPGAATEIAEEAAQEVEAAQPTPAGETIAADQLPIEDFDHLTVASIRARLRRLDVADLVLLREYEQAHAHRLQVVTMLENRIAKLEADQAEQGAQTARPERPGTAGPSRPGAPSGGEQSAAAAAEPAVAEAEAGAAEQGATPRP